MQTLMFDNNFIVSSKKFDKKVIQSYSTNLTQTFVDKSCLSWDLNVQM